MAIFLEPLEYEFFRHGLLAALMVGSLCGLIGVYVVLRGMSYVGHGLSHAAFGGAVVGFILDFNFYIGAGVMGLLAALLIDRMTQNSKIKSDAAIGIVTTAMFALGVAIISQMRTFNRSFDAALFGNILGITDQDLIIVGLVTAFTMITIFIMYRPLLFSTFDSEAAQVFGIKVRIVQLIFALLLTLSIIASMNIVGVTMIAATLIMPAMTARMMTDSFGRMQIYSIIIGAMTGIAGMYLSYFFNAASGATIVLFGALLFGLSALIKHIQEQRILRANLHCHGGLIRVHPHKHDTPDYRCENGDICPQKSRREVE
ncbi:manganese/iron transport system permease protein/iron/zinc/copper transport system permease protein [Nitrosomonas cryotolerans]|uniref:Manganese/iron transport system permease protein n=1 Tax=Nitrosomonas cryotolerans ATCC 49181 TaxID=1131553 RepID=A0A1N6HWR9_9PROT|nr:metal ABC transporter permease [Nitrosomonas cryotolerans]SFP69593.1 manganese/iron transport system permease protein/iron/zinc/copper transport system permease protein [Nitrosomonas cryotolerans]SIO24170.1 manganese/iron transport system permease protein [Nitrosomonas cryotolerans ATCC 49181]